MESKSLQKRTHGIGAEARRFVWIVPLLLVVILAPGAPPTIAQEVMPLEATTDEEQRQAAPDVARPVGPEGFLALLLPESFFRIHFLGLLLWQWVGLLLMVLLAYILSWITTWLIYRIGRSVVSRTKTEIDDKFLDVTVKPFRLIIGLVFFTLGALFLKLSVPVHQLLTSLVKGLAIAAVAWLLLRLVDELSDHAKRRFEQEGRRAAVAMIPLGVRTLKFVLVALAVIAVLQNFGFQVTAIIAGLGVGGIALALAAQKSLENLFGGATLVMDQPVRVGDFCRFGDRIGTVEDVGLRSTRVRTLDRTVVSVPNAEFSQIQIENFAKRDRIRLYCVLGLRYETSPDQLRYVLTELRKLLIAHPQVSPDPARIRLVGFGACSLDLEVYAYILTADWNEFLAVREDIFLRMMDIVKQAGSGFAFPSQTTYLSRDTGLHKERRREAEEAVQAWRKDGKLPFPNLGPELVSQLEDTLDYPPKGA